MLHTDRVYGTIEIEEPVVLGLIASPTLERLKYIDMAGYNKHFTEGMHSRFEHSLGVFCLLKKYGAPLEEQIAGLIHDVSHSAFSHCIDYVLGEGSEKEQSHQDDVFESFVRNSDIPSILDKHGIDVDYILDEKHFPLKEKDLPDLCADRIDYSLRDLMLYEKKEQKSIQDILDHLIVEDNKWIFTDFESARKYAGYFKILNDVHYSGVPTAIMFQTVGDYLKRALKKKYIDKNDLYTTDREVLAKIKPFLIKDEELRVLYDRMNLNIGFSTDKHNHQMHLYCKSRVVDPYFYHEGEIKRVSDIDAEWGKVVREDSKPKEHFISFDHT